MGQAWSSFREPEEKDYEFKASPCYIERPLGNTECLIGKKRTDKDNFANLLALAWFVAVPMVVITPWQTDGCKQIKTQVGAPGPRDFPSITRWDWGKISSTHPVGPGCVDLRSESLAHPGWSLWTSFRPGMSILLNIVFPGQRGSQKPLLLPLSLFLLKEGQKSSPSSSPTSQFYAQSPTS